ncbi:hypothetical protein [Dyella choica]|uniref:Uncharacterized protein n=1 Tax=Dyella choica TaxID=1927959 RepID=A0A3S0RMT7_9GAMM|nr:hypothetical protein [Dyella choica]RUL78958.1 hypothetical protein EKH80_03930 [Dyella choica]
MPSQSFSFAWLEERIAEYVQDADDTAVTRFELYSLAGVVVFGGLVILINLLLRNRLGQLILQAGALLEWACVMIVCVRVGYRVWRAYKRQYLDFAMHLDDFYLRYRNVVDALRKCPADEVARYLRYVRDRKTTLLYRHALLSGGMEKLGILPLLALLYLQLKEWSFGDWKDLLGHVHLIGSILLWMLAIMYLVAWWGARIKGRLDVYEALLAEAGVEEGQMSDMQIAVVATCNQGAVEVMQ